MGALVGLLFGSGALLVLLALTSPPPVRRARARGGGTAELLAAAGVEGVSPLRFAAVSAAASLTAGIVVLGVSRVPAIALAFAAYAGLAPRALLRARARRRRAELRAAWPDVADQLASGVRAGLSLPEAVAAVARRGPEVVRPAFERFAADYRATGGFDDALDRLAERLADPVADRLVAALRLAREVGGHDVGRLLRTASVFLRDESRTRGELEARQGWTVASARLALAAPWLLLLLLSSRPEAVAAYRSTAGATVLATGGAVSFAAYRLMLRVARLPEPRRAAPSEPRRAERAEPRRAERAEPRRGPLAEPLPGAHR